MIRIWVEFGKKMVPGKQGVTIARFWPFFGELSTGKNAFSRKNFKKMPRFFNKNLELTLTLTLTLTSDRFNEDENQNEDENENEDEDENEDENEK